jgi:hypothetical protein
MMKFTTAAIKTFATLIPVLKRSVNEHGIVPFGATIDEDARALIVTLISNDLVTGGNLSINGVANSILSERWSLAA